MDKSCLLHGRLRGSVPITKTPHFHASFLLVLSLSNWVGTRIRLLGWLDRPFEKTSICFHASILGLFILGPFQPCQNITLNPSSIFFSLFEGLSASSRSPLYLTKPAKNQAKPGWTYPSSGTSNSCSNPAGDSRRSQEDRDKEPGRRGQGARTTLVKGDHCQLTSLPLPTCPRLQRA